jgi:hypothetical protein
MEGNKMSKYIYGEFPTLEDIQHDYKLFKAVIQDIRTVQQVMDLMSETLLVIEINGMTPEEFVNDGGTDDTIEWIRYEQFGCLTYIYDRFDDNPMFDVWCELYHDEFIHDITIDKLTEELYNEAICEITERYNPEEKKMENYSVEITHNDIIREYVDNIVEKIMADLRINVFHDYSALEDGEENLIKLRVLDETDYTWTFAYDSMYEVVKGYYAEVLKSRGLSVNIVKTEDVVIKNFLSEIVIKVADNIYNEEFYEYEPLSSHEFEQIMDELYNRKNYTEILATDNIVHEVYKCYKECLDNRAQYYTFEIPYEGTIKVCVKARSEDDAEHYVTHKLNVYDYRDILSENLDDVYFDSPEYDDCSGDETWGIECFDALEY